MESSLKAGLLMFVLLNPFFMSVYLANLLKGLTRREFDAHLARAGLISLALFLLVAWAGESIFSSLLRIQFGSFLIFGGITFLIIGVRLILGVGPPIASLQPESGEISGAIAMPFIVGPGTISVSVIAGEQLPLPAAALAISAGLGAALLILLLLKRVHDMVQTKHERYVHRYMEVAGRITAIFTGSFAIEMIFSGFRHLSSAGPMLTP